jgi:transposase InsO family protein
VDRLLSLAIGKTKDVLSRLYYGLERASAYSSGDKLRAAAASDQGHTKSAGRTCVLGIARCLYNAQTCAKKIFRNAYDVNNVLDLWQSDLLDLQAFAEHNNNYRYVLSVIDVFSKYLHLVPLKSKSGSAVAEAFGSILRDSRYMKPRVRRPLVVQTDKGKEYVNHPFQDLLRREGIEHRVCRNPDVKCAVVESVHLTIREKIYRYFTHRNTFRYISVLQKFVSAYNNTVNLTGVATAKVNDSNILEIRKKINGDNIKRVHVVKPKYKLGKHVRISRKRMRFAKSAEQNYSTEIFRISKVIK